MLYEKDVLHVVLILSKEKIEFYKAYAGYYNFNNHINALTRWLAEDDKNRKRSTKVARHISTCLVL